jgi:hypothetical protein
LLHVLFESPLGQVPESQPFEDLHPGFVKNTFSSSATPFSMSNPENRQTDPEMGDATKGILALLLVAFLIHQSVN